MFEGCINITGMKRKEYIYLLSDRDRKRHVHTRMGKTITDFVVQYESFINGVLLFAMIPHMGMHIKIIYTLMVQRRK